jgi:thioesterase domain-containing protein/acyl carrier protein
LINQYGPTEAHVVSSYTINQPGASSTLPPVGKPIDNTSLYILDKQLHLLPLGVAGEICITGAGVAKGYLNNEQLTTEKFVANPFGRGQMYRTGDIGRWLPDGNIEFLGRMDEQVKIRGHRVEIGEIESVLQQCNFISQCVVVAKESGNGTKQLVCYVVPREYFDQDAIVAYLEARLPGYMIPSLFIEIKALPVTTNGKVDKNALPAPGAVLTDTYVAPRTALESTLVTIWQEVLGIEKVSIRDNFFELGGHSLLVVKTMAKIKAHTGRNMPLGSLFQYPTVEKYARFLLENYPSENTKHIVPIKSGSGKLPLYIVCHIGIAPLSRFVPFAGLLDDQQPVYGIQLPEIDEMDSQAISIEGIASSYVTELLSHDPHGPYAFAGYSIGGLIAVEMAKQLKTRGKEVAFLGLFDTIAYTKEAMEPVANRQAESAGPAGLYGKLKRIAYTWYYKLDNDLYLLKTDTKNTIRCKKNNLVRRIERLLNIRINTQPKSEAQLLWEAKKRLSMAVYIKYKLVPYDGSITLFRAKKRTLYFADSKFLGWKPFAKSVSIVEAEGNHYTMFNPAHCKHLAKRVQQCLDGCSVDAGYKIN